MAIKDKIKTIIKKFIYKRGIKTNKHIIVFESDDWGATRVPSKDVLELYMKKYSNFTPDQYQSYDTLETTEDIEELKKVLLSHKDSNNQPAIFTLNFATANPDFDKIKADNYKHFYFVPFSESYKGKDKKSGVISSVKDGILSKSLMPQLHSREHINSTFLLNDIRDNVAIKDAFDLNMIGVSKDNYCGMDVLNNEGNYDLNKDILVDSYKIFENNFAFKSSTFIAPCYVWSMKDELILKELGVKALQGKLRQNIPLKRDVYKKKVHTFGEKSKSGLIYMGRNCNFEPSKLLFEGVSQEQIIDKALKEIDFAFACKKPAIICSHRVNYVSGISKENRDVNLKLLNELLTQITQKYKDIIFLPSNELINILGE